MAGLLGISRSWTNALFSVASTVAAINFLVAGVGVVILLTVIFGTGSLALAVPAGAIVVLLLMVAAIVYQLRRFEQTVAGRG